MDSGASIPLIFNRDFLDNILAKVSNHYRITIDTDIDNAIYVYNNDGSYIHFHQTKWDVYEMQVGDSTDMAECHMLTTVKETGM